jgi:hypothetical protein
LITGKCRKGCAAHDLLVASALSLALLVAISSLFPFPFHHNFSLFAFFSYTYPLWALHLPPLAFKLPNPAGKIILETYPSFAVRDLFGISYYSSYLTTHSKNTV